MCSICYLSEKCKRDVFSYIHYGQRELTTMCRRRIVFNLLTAINKSVNPVRQGIAIWDTYGLFSGSWHVYNLNTVYCIQLISFDF